MAVPAKLDASSDSGPPSVVPPKTAGLGLSAKLLIMTALFVMLAEILIFVPSVANFRINWLNDRLTAARLASLAIENMPDGNVPADLKTALLNLAQVKAVAIKKDEQRRMVLPPDAPLVIDKSFDLRLPMSAGWFDAIWGRMGLIGDALDVYLTSSERIIRVVGRGEPGMEVGVPRVEFVEIVIPQSILRTAMINFGLNILLLSIIISMIAATLLYLALARLLVRPIMRLTDNMLSFSSRPEDASRIIVPSSRTDEIGTAERELADMQRELSQLLHQKTRLAQLGLAVSKINHDLRNMLASAQLISDRLAMLKDPAVQRFAPKLIASLDRAIAFCNDTVRFGRAEEASPNRERISLLPLIEEVSDGLGLPRERIGWRVDIDDGLIVDVDRHQIYRVLNNIVRNAVQVLESQDDMPGEIRIAATRLGRVVRIEVDDNGPGLPPKAKANLFQAFQGAARKGGTGLGLAIAAELIAAHGGTIRLEDLPRGARFAIEIPDRGTG